MPPRPPSRCTIATKTAARALREISIELSVFGSEGRQGKLDAAETEREHATSEHTRVGQRARAAQLLRSVMARHRDTTRLRYVEPYRTELQRLGRPGVRAHLRGRHRQRSVHP